MICGMVLDVNDAETRSLAGQASVARLPSVNTGRQWLTRLE
jgi:hypothetical protein